MFFGEVLSRYQVYYYCWWLLIIRYDVLGELLYGIKYIIVTEDYYLLDMMFLGELLYGYEVYSQCRVLLVVITRDSSEN